MRFAGDAFNSMRRFDRPSLTKYQYPSEEKKAAWSAVRNNRIVELNNKYVIGDSILPELYDSAVNDYQRHIVSRAEALQIRHGFPLLVAVAQAVREVSPRFYTGGLPAEASFLRQYAAASRDPVVRKIMDIPENGIDEHGVLLSPVDTVKEYNRRSFERTVQTPEIDWEELFF